jgi:hypothetical protein
MDDAIPIIARLRGGSRQSNAIALPGNRQRLLQQNRHKADMPVASPLGVHADLLVLVWVQMAVILGLSLFVITWVARR